jgi:hypothetical protein
LKAARKDCYISLENLEVHFPLQEQSGAIVLDGIFFPKVKTYASPHRTFHFLTFLCHWSSFHACFLGYAGEPSTEIST